MLQPSSERWSVGMATDLYEVTRWGHGYFSINPEGRVQVHPERDAARSIDIQQLIERLQLRGLDPPILLRFNGILEHRLREIRLAFARALEDHEYVGSYMCVYPIKVNQQRQVVEQIMRHSRHLGYGLEAGSKPELLAVVAIADNEVPIICNGFKDDEFIETAMLAHKMGRRIIPVVERFSELELILRHAERVEVRPTIGMRVKLAASGSGRWRASGGHRSKFGLTTSELLQGLALLRANGMEDCLRVLHFHLGSQVTNIRHIKAALIEGARIYTDLVLRGAGLRSLDVGGGLGVDYDGSQTDFDSSVNYTLQEYANDVVYHVQQVCDDAGVEHPDLITESGRAVAAYHSVLVFNVLGVSGPGRRAEPVPVDEATSGDPPPIQTLRETAAECSSRNLVESYHNAQQALDMTMSLFDTGHLSLEQRGAAEDLFWRICQKIRGLSRELDEPPEELLGLDRLLCDTYFCNFSIFQSLPDSWAIKQLFPIMPIHRLNERPSVHADLGDITCDSDGRIDHFINRRDTRRTLPLHFFDERPYYLGAFLIGAYQEILGDLHNLFGDTNAAHINLGPQGEVEIATLVKGDSVTDVLGYVQFERSYLLNRLQSSVENAVQENRLGHREAGRFLRFYEDGLNGYTYLEDPRESAGG